EDHHQNAHLPDLHHEGLGHLAGAAGDDHERMVDGVGHGQHLVRARREVANGRLELEHEVLPGAKPTTIGRSRPPRVQTPRASAPQISLWSWICIRASSPESKSQRARSRSSTSPKTGEKRSAAPRRSRPWRRITSTDQWKSSSLATTNFSSSRGPSVESRAKSSSLATSPEPGGLTSTIFATSGGSASHGRWPCVSTATS